MRVNMDKDDLLAVLRDFDSELAAHGYGGMVEIHAIGGFAIMWHGLRDGGGTGDIDTVTATYDEEVLVCMDAVARRNDIAPDWLNNDCVLTYNEDDFVSDEDIYYYEADMGGVYEPSGVEFSHIDLSIADIPTLVRAKVEAVNSARGVSRTSKDVADLVELFRAEGVGSLSQAVSRHPYLAEREYAACRRHMGQLAGFGGGAGGAEAVRQRAVAEAKAAQRTTAVRPARQAGR